MIGLFSTAIHMAALQPYDLTLLIEKHHVLSKKAPRCPLSKLTWEIQQIVETAMLLAGSHEVFQAAQDMHPTLDGRQTMSDRAWSFIMCIGIAGYIAAIATSNVIAYGYRWHCLCVLHHWSHP